MNFQINFSTTGVYYVHVRFPPLPTADNTVNVGMNGSVTTAGLAQGSTSKWKWMKAANTITFRPPALAHSTSGCARTA